MEVFKSNNRQHYFIKEIIRLNYNYDEAVAEITNNCNRYQYYNEYMEAINYWFYEKPNGRLWIWIKDPK